MKGLKIYSRSILARLLEGVVRTQANGLGDFVAFDQQDKLISQKDNKDYLAAINGETGIECFDFWVQELRNTNYLHNHARMWFASI